jgi:hypothetical protein
LGRAANAIALLPFRAASGVEVAGAFDGAQFPVMNGQFVYQEEEVAEAVG